MCSAVSRGQSHQLGAFSDRSYGGPGLVKNSVVIMSTIVALALGLGTVKTNTQIRTVLGEGGVSTEHMCGMNTRILLIWLAAVRCDGLTLNSHFLWSSIQLSEISDFHPFINLFFHL